MPYCLKQPAGLLSLLTRRGLEKVDRVNAEKGVGEGILATV